MTYMHGAKCLLATLAIALICCAPNGHYFQKSMQFVCWEAEFTLKSVNDDA